MSVAALIIGGGPAGSAAAITLARGGMAPHLVERQSGPAQGVCGAFLGWDAIAALEALGIDPWRLGARPIASFRLVTPRRTVEAALPRMAAGLSRRLLDAALIDAAISAGAIVTRGRTARSADPETRTVRFDDGEAVTAQALFLATGKHELRGLARRFATSSIGLRAALPPKTARQDALAGVVELHLFDKGYAGLLIQEDGAANLCLSVERHRLSRAGSVPALLADVLAEAPGLAARLDGTVPSHFDAIAGVPYGWRADGGPQGLFRIGDQGAVIASLAGDGIALALTSGASAAQALLTGGPDVASDWQQGLRRRCRAPLGLAELLRHGAASPLTRGPMMQLLHLMPGLGTRAAALTRAGAPARRTGERRSGERS